MTPILRIGPVREVEDERKGMKRVSGLAEVAVPVGQSRVMRKRMGKGGMKEKPLFVLYPSWFWPLIPCDLHDLATHED